MDITLPRQAFTYKGNTVALATAPWLGNVAAIYRYNTAGTVFLAFKPGLTVNGFTTLENGMTYVVYATTRPFTIPTFDTPGKTSLSYVVSNTVFTRP